MAIPKHKVTGVRELRRKGLTIREIAGRTGVHPATVHRHVRGVQIAGHHPSPPVKTESRTDHGFPKEPGRYIKIERGRRYHGLLIHHLLLLGVFFLFWFVGYLHRYLSEASGEQDRWVASVALGGGLIAGATLLLVAHFAQASTILKDYGGETETAKALFVLDWNSYLLVEAPALAALVGATTLIGFRSKLFPWWLNSSGALLTARAIRSPA